VFFFREKIPREWLMDQVLAMCGTGFAPTQPYSVMERLQKLSPSFPDRAAQVLSALVKNRRFNKWVYMTQAAGVRLILGMVSKQDRLQRLQSSGKQSTIWRP